jgi:hypothetical protein
MNDVVICCVNLPYGLLAEAGAGLYVGLLETYT